MMAMSVTGHVDVSSTQIVEPANVVFWEHGYRPDGHSKVPDPTVISTRVALT